jgi:Flp pilus assembly protein TadG
MIHPPNSRRRRGAVILECSFVLPIVFLLTLGIIVLGFGVFRYQEMAWLAREGARWAAVHGPTYQTEQSQAAPTSQTVMTNAIAPKMVLLSPSSLTCTLSMTNGLATVNLSYNWTPEAYFGTTTLSSKSVVPILY